MLELIRARSIIFTGEKNYKKFNKEKVVDDVVNDLFTRKIEDAKKDEGRNTSTAAKIDFYKHLRATEYDQNDKRDEVYSHLLDQIWRQIESHQKQEESYNRANSTIFHQPHHTRHTRNKMGDEHQFVTAGAGNNAMNAAAAKAAEATSSNESNVRKRSDFLTLYKPSDNSSGKPLVPLQQT